MYSNALRVNPYSLRKNRAEGTENAIREIARSPR